jgi:inner membrane transporter RhtA
VPAQATKTSQVEPAPAGWREPLRRFPASVLLGAGIISVQVGAGFAGRLFGTVSPAGITGLRLWAACLLFVAFGGRSAFRTLRSIFTERAWRDAAIVVAFGLTLGVMNFAIYQSFARIPLGIAVTIEFAGPLGIAVALSRRRLDLAAAALAAVGIVLLADPSGGSVDAVGVVFALVAAACWALYILVAQAASRVWSGGRGLAVAMGVAVLVPLVPGIAGAGSDLLDPRWRAIGCAVALMSSVVPYSLETEALRRLPANVFGVLMSVEPAVAAIAGWVIFG